MASVVPASPAKKVNPELLVEVDVNKTTPKKKPAVQSRLENSPRKVLTPEVIAARQKTAEERRQQLEHAKAAKAHQDAAKAKDVARRVRTEKENSPAPSPVKGQ